MNTAKLNLGSHITIQRCFYHFCQLTFRKLQELGLSERYKKYEAFRKFCTMVDRLAFLPSDDVKNDMEWLKQDIPTGVEDLLIYVDTTYVNGSLKRIEIGKFNIRLRRIPPVFPFCTWNEIDNEILREKSKQLVVIYSEDLEPDLENEIIQFKTIVKHFSAEEKSSMYSLLETLTTSKLNNSFPNVEIALKLFVSIPCSNASGERSFSVLKRVKNYQRTSLSDEKMSSLALMNIENCVLQSIDWNDFVKEFVAQKARKKFGYTNTTELLHQTNVIEAINELKLTKLKNTEWLFLQEYCQVVELLETSLDKLQDEDSCFLGFVAPTMLSLMNKLMNTLHLAYCQP
ncbi:hypothetical protein QTP88_007404 [Uroleucon formosanum]